MKIVNLKTTVSVGLLLAFLADMPAQDSSALNQLRETRKQLAHKQRRIIFNNDGCDALYLPKGEKLSVEKFLDKRTTFRQLKAWEIAPSNPF